MMTDDRASRQGSDTVRFRVFVAPRAGFVWTRTQRLDRCDITRREAEAFINDKIGADNLINVSESNWGETFDVSGDDSQSLGVPGDTSNRAIWWNIAGSRFRALPKRSLPMPDCRVSGSPPSATTTCSMQHFRVPSNSRGKVAGRASCPATAWATRSSPSGSSALPAA